MYRVYGSRVVVYPRIHVLYIILYRFGPWGKVTHTLYVFPVVALPADHSTYIIIMRTRCVYVYEEEHTQSTRIRSSDKPKRVYCVCRMGNNNNNNNNDAPPSPPPPVLWNNIILLFTVRSHHTTTEFKFKWANPRVSVGRVCTISDYAARRRRATYDICNSAASLCAYNIYNIMSAGPSGEV
jgi:hypothetical protein